MAKWVFPTPGGAEDQDVFGALQKAQCGELPDDFAVQAGLEGEVELLDGLHPGEAGGLEAGFEAAQVPSAPLGQEGGGEEVAVVHLAFGGLLAEGVELVAEMVQLHAFQQAG
jgi:hypothetical protein